MVQAVVAVATAVGSFFVRRGPQIVANAALAATAGYIQRRLQGREESVNLLSEDLNTLSQGAVTDCALIYGETGVAGEVVFQHVHSDKRWISYVVQFADGGQVIPHDFIKLIIEGQDVTFNGSGDAIGHYAGVMKFRFYGGSPDQTADSQLITDSGGRWTSAHRGRSRVYGVWSLLQTDEGKYPNGRPDPIFVIRGRRVYDPRLDTTAGGSGAHRLADESTWAWSRNAALCVADYARGAQVAGKSFMGGHLPARLIDSAFLIDAANASDDNGWTLDGVVTSGQDAESVLRTMALHMAGRIITRKGKLAIIAGDARAPILTLTEDDLAGAFRLETARPWREAVNVASARYRDAAAGYELAETTPLVLASYVAEDGGREFPSDYEMGFTADRAHATRLAKAAVIRERFPRSIEAPFKLLAAAAGEGDLVAVDFPSYGINETYEVQTRSVDPSGFVALGLRQYDPDAALDWDAAEAGAAPTFSRIDRGSRTPADASGWSLTAATQSAGGVLIPSLVVAGTAPAEVEGVLVEIRLSGGASWATVADALAGRFEVSPLLPSQGYDVSVRYRAGRSLSVNRQILSATTTDTFAASSAGNVAWEDVTGTGRPADGATVNRVFYQAGAPTSPVDGDVWHDTDAVPPVTNYRVGSTWVIGPNLTTNTNQLTDGAGLGTTATWPNVTGTGRPADYATRNATTTGASAPSSPGNGDIWHDTSVAPQVTRVRIGGVWVIVSNLSTEASHLSDGAALLRPRPNLLYNGGFRLQGAEWSLGSWYYATLSDGPAIVCNTAGTHIASSAHFPVEAGRSYTLAAEGIAVNRTAGNLVCDIIWLNSSGDTVSDGGGPIFPTDAGWNRVAHTETAPTGATTAYIRAFTEGIAFSAGGLAAIRRIKFEQATTPSPFTDDATYGALFIDGVRVDALRPAEAASTRGAPSGSPVGGYSDAASVKPAVDAAATTATWGGTSGRPSNIASLSGSEAINNAAVGVGGNAVINSTFEAGSLGWVHTSGSIGGAIIVNTGQNHCRVYLAANTTATGYLDVLVQSAGGWAGAGDVIRFGLPVRPGDRIYAGALVCGGGGTTATELYVIYTNASNAAFGDTWLAHSSLSGYPGADLTGYAKIGGFATVPSGAVYAHILVRATKGATNSDGGAYVAEPQLCIVPAGQTQAPPYTPGPTDRQATRGAPAGTPVGGYSDASAIQPAIVDAATRAMWDNVTGRPEVPPPQLTATPSHKVRSATRAGAGSVTTPTVTVTASGGASPYTYQWSQIGGDEAEATAAAAATTAFRATIAVGETRVTTWECVVTDAGGRSASALVRGVFSETS